MKFSGLLGAAALALSFAAAPAEASVLFTGSTEGCFGAGCSTFSTTATDNPKLTFASGSFSGSTDNTLSVNLGTFSLGTGTHTYTGDDFTLEVLFSVPAGVSPNGTSSTFDATVSGQVQQGQNGNVSVNFDNTAHSYSWAGGTFTLAVDDVSPFSVGHSNSITGEIVLTSVSAVPEPGTWAMMLIGFCGLGFLTYRKQLTHRLV
jgi:hypothetical protein